MCLLMGKDSTLLSSTPLIRVAQMRGVLLSGGWGCAPDWRARYDAGRLINADPAQRCKQHKQTHRSFYWPCPAAAGHAGAKATAPSAAIKQDITVSKWRGGRHGGRIAPNGSPAHHGAVTGSAPAVVAACAAAAGPLSRLRFALQPPRPGLMLRRPLARAKVARRCAAPRKKQGQALRAQMRPCFFLGSAAAKSHAARYPGPKSGA